MKFSTQEELKILKREVESVLERINSLLTSEKDIKEQVEDTIKEVCRYAEITEQDLLTSKKGDKIFYKQILAYILTDRLNVTLQTTADRLDIVSHATVKHHRDKMRWWMDNPQYAPKGLVVATNNIISNLGL